DLCCIVPPPTRVSHLSLHDALPILGLGLGGEWEGRPGDGPPFSHDGRPLTLRAHPPICARLVEGVRWTGSFLPNGRRIGRCGLASRATPSCGRTTWPPPRPRSRRWPGRWPVPAANACAC